MDKTQIQTITWWPERYRA